MFYETDKNDHGLKFNPFKSCIVPRPIAWITSMDKTGSSNCAPYSFFNGVASDPPMIMFANNGKRPTLPGPKDSLSNIRETEEFVVNIVSYDSKDAMNDTCAPLGPGESEIEFAKLEVLHSNLIKPVRLKISPINLECKLYKILELPADSPEDYNGIVIGTVVGIHINDEVIKDGRVNLSKIKPLSRLGYMDYSVVDNIFVKERPKCSPRPFLLKNVKE